MQYQIIIKLFFFRRILYKLYIILINRCCDELIYYEYFSGFDNIAKIFNIHQNNIKYWTLFTHVMFRWNKIKYKTLHDGGQNSK